MYNLLISLAAGLAVTLAIRFGTNVGWVGSILPGLLALGIAYFLLARRSWKQLEAIIGIGPEGAHGPEVRPGPAEPCNRGSRSPPGSSWWPPRSTPKSACSATCGRTSQARSPTSRRASPRHGIARTMLALTHYRKKDLERMRKVFDEAAKDNEKEGLVFASWAWVEEKEGNHDPRHRRPGPWAQGQSGRRELQGSGPGPAERQAAQAGQALRGAVVPVPPGTDAAADGLAGRPGRRPPGHLPAALPARESRHPALTPRRRACSLSRGGRGRVGGSHLKDERDAGAAPGRGAVGTGGAGRVDPGTQTDRLCAEIRDRARYLAERARGLSSPDWSWRGTPAPGSSRWTRRPSPTWRRTCSGSRPAWPPPPMRPLPAISAPARYRGGAPHPPRRGRHRRAGGIAAGLEADYELVPSPTGTTRSPRPAWQSPIYVVLDLRLPGIDGLAVLDALRGICRPRRCR